MSVVIAAALPLAALLVASHVVVADTRQRAMAQLQATGRAVAGQVRQSYADAAAQVAASPGRPALTTAVSGGDTANARIALAHLVASAPLIVAALYDPAGRLVAEVPPGGHPIGGITAAGGGAVAAGAVQFADGRPVRPLAVAIPTVGGPPGRLEADIDVGRLMVQESSLRIGRTGTGALVSTAGRVVADGDPSRIGDPAGQPPAGVLQTWVSVPGEPWSVLVRQSTEEAYGGVGQLVRGMRLTALAFAALGVLLATGTVAALVRRDRRIRDQARELVEAAELFRSAFEQAPTAIMIGGNDLRIQRVNAAFCALLGYGADEVIGQPGAFLSHPDDIEMTRSLVHQLTAGEIDSYDIEKRYVRADGRVLWVAVRVAAARDADGRVAHAIAHLTDVTEERTSAEAMARANAELRAANELKDHFVAVTSHELRSPLTSIIGFTALLREHWHALSDEQRRDYLGRVERQGRRLDSLVEDLLTMSAIQAGALSIAPARVRVVDAFREVLDEVMLDGAVDILCAQDLSVWADPGRLRQILVNYATNARKYGAAPFVLSAAEDGPTVTLAISDRGAGVPPEFVDRLFDSFTQASTGAARDASGTGLGLSIVRRLAEAQGGSASYAANPDGGAVFSVTLPNADQPAARGHGRPDASPTTASVTSSSDRSLSR